MTSTLLPWISSSVTPGRTLAMAFDLRLEHQLVNGLLLSRKRPTDRERAGDVAGVVAVLAAGVDEQQIAGFDPAVVLAVVENARVGTGAHDAAISWALRAAAPEGVEQQRLDLVLVHARPGAGHRELVGLPRDARRSSHGLDLPRPTCEGASRAESRPGPRAP